MTEESRFGPTVRERTKLLAALLRTPNDKLLTYAQAHTLAEDLDVVQLRKVRDLMDELGKGIKTTEADPFWRQLDALWSLLYGSPNAASPAPPVAPAPAAPAISQPTAPVQSPTEATPAEADARAKVDFRQAVMQQAPPQRAPSATAAMRPEDCRPQVPNGHVATSGQSEMASSGDAAAINADLRAVSLALSWPLERVAQLYLAVSDQREQGEPPIDELCQRFDLPSELILDNVIRLWQARLDKSERLAREHAELVLELRKNKTS